MGKVYTFKELRANMSKILRTLEESGENSVHFTRLGKDWEIKKVVIEESLRNKVVKTKEEAKETVKAIDKARADVHGCGCQRLGPSLCNKHGRY